MKEYKGVKSDKEPLITDAISSPTTVYIRNNKIQESKDTCIIWTYDEIQYTKDEYIQYLSEQNNKLQNSNAIVLFTLMNGGLL